MRSSDTASRIGGDEFVLVCPTDIATREAAQIQARLQSAIGAPVDVDGVRVTTGASIGTALFPADGTDAAGLIDKADKAMYRVKLRDRDEVRILKRCSTNSAR
jgi:diguanylate cyclase (GGDEF)-like protein